MDKQPPSIFNDVIGPVMRGPSSSHTAAAVRIGRMIRQFVKDEIKYFQASFDSKGSLATTYSSQGSDIGLIGGLLGMDTDDSGLVDAINIASSRGIVVNFKIDHYGASHPNTYRICVKTDRGEEYRFIFISTGGGMIELREINGVPTNISGDYFETLLFFTEDDPLVLEKNKCSISNTVSDFDYCLVSYAEKSGLINLKTKLPLPENELEALWTFNSLLNIIELRPVLPIQSSSERKMLFTTAAEVLTAAEAGSFSIFDLAVKYESLRGDIDGKDVIKIGEEIIEVMRNSIKEGLKGVDYEDRILGPQAKIIYSYPEALIGGSLVKKLISYITAVMETKSAMGVIVAAPTAGSCAGLPGTLLAVADDMGFDDCIVLRGLLAAGLIGILIVARSTFAAEECGCQAECGSSSAMTAAGLVQMMGGSAKQALSAASMALQNVMGLVCDPVANRVEVPCLGKNVLAGMNAIAAANMALTGFDPVIPLDETITALDQVGRMLPAELRCTGKAGLSTTPTSITIKDRLCRNHGKK